MQSCAAHTNAANSRHSAPTLRHPVLVRSACVAAILSIQFPPSNLYPLAISNNRAPINRYQKDVSEYSIFGPIIPNPEPRSLMFQKYKKNSILVASVYTTIIPWQTYIVVQELEATGSSNGQEKVAIVNRV